MAKHVDALEKSGLGIVRKVVRVEYRPGQFRGSFKVAHHLECGHIVVAKESDGRPDRKLCRLCKTKKGRA